MSARRFVYLFQATPVSDDGHDRPQYWSCGARHLSTYNQQRWVSCVQANGGSPYTYDVTIPIGDTLGGASRPGFGALVLLRDKTSLASLAALHFDGRPLKIWRGYEGDPFASFTLLFDGTTDTPTFTSATVTIPLQDIGALVDKPAQAHLYAGTGDYEGGSELKGTPKPLMLGSINNAEPIALDHAQPAVARPDGVPASPYSRVIQIHDGAIKRDAYLQILERGVPFGLANQITVPDVYAWPPEGGKVAVDYARGVARLGSAPIGVITVDAAADDVGSTHANLAVRILLRNGEITPNDIDQPAMAAFQAAQPADLVGVYIADQRTVGQVLDALALSAGAFWSFTPRRQFFMRQIAWGASVGTITAADLVTVLRPQPAAPPVKQYKFGYLPVERVLTDSDIGNAAVPPSDRAALGDAFQYDVRTSSTVATVRKLSRETSTTSRFLLGIDASPEGARQFALLSQNRQRYVATVRAPLETYALGDTVTLQVADYGLDAGKDFLIVGKKEQPAFTADTDTAELTLWGPRHVGSE